MREPSIETERRSAAHAAVMDDLKRKLGGILTAVPRDRPIVYLDYPVHDNVGDLLIHAGADAFLQDYGHEVLGRYSIHDFCRRPVKTEHNIVFKRSIADLDRLVARRDPILVLHGGGNIGDIYPEFQYFREMIVKRYMNSEIVILPQSIHFQHAEAQARAASVFGAHRRLTIFVRDVESQAFVRDDCGLDVALMPDMAQHLWGRLPLPAATTPHRTLILRRRDPEARDRSAIGPGTFDWADLKRSGDRTKYKLLRKWQLIDTPLRHLVTNVALWRPYRDDMIRRGVRLFDGYDEVDTDRLHGIILAALMGRRVRYGEGTYGKLHRYASVWLKQSPLVVSADR